MRTTVVAGLVVVAWSALTACGRGEVQDSAVVASSPTCPPTGSLSDCTASVTMATTEAELTAALASWGYPVGAVRWSGRPLLLVGINETSSCHAVVRAVAVDGSAVAVELGLEHKDDCTTDSRPRSFVLDSGADTIASVTVNGEPAELSRP